MAPCNVFVVHHTAAREGFGGIEYRERMAGLPRGPLSLYGLIPTLLSVGLLLIIGLLAPLPYICSIVKKLSDSLNAPLQHNVRKLVFNGFQPTGKTYVHGYGISKNGKTRVYVKLHSEFDAGLGFTMLSACTVGSELAKRSSSLQSSLKPGCCSAVVALGGESLAEALRVQGVKIEVTVETVK